MAHRDNVVLDVDERPHLGSGLAYFTTYVFYVWFHCFSPNLGRIKSRNCLV